MKAKYIYTIMMAMALTFGMASCDDDDNNGNTEQQKPATKTELKCDMDTVKVGIGETASFNILEGGGDYKVICENEDVVTATLEGTTVTLNSQKMGLTGVIISDAEGNYKRVIVKSMYMNLNFGKEELFIGMKLGHTDGKATLNVLEGNGSYKIDVADETIARVIAKTETSITFQGINAGETTCVVTDLMGLQKTIKVKVETTTIPFTEDEKAAILAITKNVVNWNGQDGYQWGDYTVKDLGDGKMQAKWDYYNWYYMTCTWTGDATVGKKGTGTFVYNMNYKKSFDVDVEIIKNDGSRVWGICSCVKDDYLNTGYFCIAL